VEFWDEHLLKSVEIYCMNYEEALQVLYALLYVKFNCVSLEENVNKALEKLRELLKRLKPHKKKKNYRLKYSSLGFTLKEDSTKLSGNAVKDLEKSFKGLTARSIPGESLLKNKNMKQSKVNSDIFANKMFGKDVQDGDVSMENDNKAIKNLNASTSFKDFKKMIDDEVKGIKEKYKAEHVDEKKIKKMEKKKIKLQKLASKTTTSSEENAGAVGNYKDVNSISDSTTTETTPPTQKKASDASNNANKENTDSKN